MRYELDDGYIDLTLHKGDTNKMDKMVSLNVSVHNSEFCRLMSQIPGTTCSKCYADRLETIYTNVTHCFTNNEIMLRRLWKEHEVPILHCPYFRSNSFGEFNTLNHYKNILQMVEANPNTFFAIWTKRPGFIKKAFKKFDNLNHIYSSVKVNVKSKLPKGFDKVFTVNTSSYMETKGIVQNCQGKCFTCNICYSKNDIVDVHEKLR